MPTTCTCPPERCDWCAGQGRLPESVTQCPVMKLWLGLLTTLAISWDGPIATLPHCYTATLWTWTLPNRHHGVKSLKCYFSYFPRLDSQDFVFVHTRFSCVTIPTCLLLLNAIHRIVPHTSQSHNTTRLSPACIKLKSFSASTGSGSKMPDSSHSILQRDRRGKEPLLCTPE